MLEDRLELKIKAFLRSDQNPITRQFTLDIFRPSGPLGSFSVKIKMGFMLQIYGAYVLKDLETIKDIRNLFAHNLGVHDFQTQSVRDRCMNLKIVEEYVQLIGNFDTPNSIGVHFTDARDEVLNDPKYRYSASCSVFAMLLGARDGPQMEPIRGDSFEFVPAPDKS